MTFSIVACDMEEHTGVSLLRRNSPQSALSFPGRRPTLARWQPNHLPIHPLARGLALMGMGLSAQEALARLLEDDPDKELRQVGLVDARGGSATFTGEGCFAWAGGVTGKDYAIQGNILASSKVVPAMEKAFLKAKGSLPTRLHAALLAGDRAGGDKTRRQSAALYVVKPRGGYGGFLDRWLDYRVDDHEDPVLRLAELLEMHDLYFGKSPENERVEIKGAALEQITAILTKENYLKKGKDFRAAFTEFIGNENFEERADSESLWIDAPVLKYLVKKFSSVTASRSSATLAPGASAGEQSPHDSRLLP